MDEHNIRPVYYARDIKLRKNEVPDGIVAYIAKRIWNELPDGTVIYTKNNYETKVNMQEFLWVKLKAAVIE